MPAKRELSMRQLRHLLRLHHDGVSAREIGRRLGVARSTIQDNLKRAAAAGLAWPLADDVTDEALATRLFGRAGVTQGQRRRAEPDWAALARELKRPGVTMTILWEEYREAHPEGYGYSRFCQYSDEIAANTARLADFRRSDVPLLLIWGKSDPYLHLTVAEYMRSQARNAALHVLEAGHWPQIDEPADVARIMLASQ